MKKISLFIVGLLFIFPVAVFAANPDVKELETSVTDSKIRYTGTTDTGLTAVMCKLYNGNDEIKKMSLAVSNDEFSGDFDVLENGEYVVSCARYEGGKIVSANAIVSSITTNNNESTTNNEVSNTNSNKSTTTTSTVSNSDSNSTSTKKATTSNPNTLDNIKLYIGLFVLALVGIISAIILKKKKNI